MNENQTVCGSMACLSVYWRSIIRWDLESHGIYMMLQLTTLLYFEVFDGDSPKTNKQINPLPDEASMK